MLESERPYGETRTFSSEASKYGYGDFQHRRFDIDGLRRQIAIRVWSLTPDRVLTISFAGFPWVGKTSQLRHIVSESVKALRWWKQRLISYPHPESGIETEVGRKARDGSVGVLHGDHMFRAIGPDRRGLMLDGKANFRRYWGDDERLVRIYSDIIAGRSPSDRVYRGSAREKTEKTPLWEVRLLAPMGEWEKKVMVLEWVQSIESLRAIESRRWKYRLETLKILFDVSVVDSIIRLLRREHDEKRHPDGSPYSFREIFEHRLIEQYYILETFIGPAYSQDDIILLDKPREMPPFRVQEREEILEFLASYRLAPRHAKDEDLSKFVYGLVARLEDYFSVTVWVEESEYATWRQARLEKKRRQAMETTS